MSWRLFLPSISVRQWTWNDDVIKWKHFPYYWPFVNGIHRWPVDSPHKGQWRGALMFPLIFAWTNRWVNSRYASDLKRHRARYDVTVVYFSPPSVSDSGRGILHPHRVRICSHSLDFVFLCRESYISTSLIKIPVTGGFPHKESLMRALHVLFCFVFVITMNKFLNERLSCEWLRRLVWRHGNVMSLRQYLISRKWVWHKHGRLLWMTNHLRGILHVGHVTPHIHHNAS